MKKVLFSFLALCFVAALHAQENPVNWSFTAKKVADKVYEVRMTATIQNGWHLYSQTQPADAINIPTKFNFTNNPLLSLNGKVAEVGKMQKVHDEAVGASANQYAKTVTFVQKVALKSKAKTDLAGTVEFQTCDDKRCLPPKKVPFKVPVGG